MAEFIPIRLAGNNLGERHRLLNSKVKDAFQVPQPFEAIQNLQEESLVDRLFKIDLASKYRNIDYIFQNLKDPDMLFVSRALKCTWLLDFEYEDNINAKYLETELFPHMTTTAVYKMLHFIQHHLREPERCKDFYTYYKDRNFKIALKFLWNCSAEYLLEEFKYIMDRIDTRNLKVLSERCPRVTKIFYEHMEQEQNILKIYLSNEKSFFNNIKYILKSDPETFFDVVEKYFNIQKFDMLGPNITKHIMVNHRNRFFCKPELYTAWLLDIKILAIYLSHDEVKEIVLKLARSEYLDTWFTYQKVEPLIKRLTKEERVAFKNLVFVDKAIGNKIKDWPYTPPSPPVLKETPGYSLFQDREYDIIKKKTTKRLIKKRKGPRSEHIQIHTQRTLLDDLFDRFRFVSFEASFQELRKRLKAESNLQNREFMMLVLVSKSGGREDSLRTLLGLLSQYRNEPVHFRAAIVRSLVKRAFVWRLADDLWADLLQWGHGLGLDGSPSEINCTEGIHAVILRHLLTNQTFEPIVSKLFFDNFTYFTEYSLNTAEHKLLRTTLPRLFLDAAVSETGSKKRTLLEHLLTTLDEYKIPSDKFPGVIEVIKSAVQEDLESSEYILIHLYNAHVARKTFFKENFSLICDTSSYINALKHDISVITVDKSDKRLAAIVENESFSNYKQFFRKLMIYFAEPEGLAEQFRVFLMYLAETRPHTCLAKPLCLLAGNNFTTLLKTLDSAPNKSAKRRLAAALRANAHNTRPRIELKVLGWQAAGAKAIANFVFSSPRNQLEEMVKDLLTWHRTIRLALTLTDNIDTKCTAFKIMSALRPGVALKMFLHYLNVGKIGSKLTTIWNTVKHLITELDYEKRSRLCKNLENIKSVPALIKPEYYVHVYEAFIKIDNEMALRILCRIENICFDVNGTFYSSVVNNIIENEFDKENEIYHRRKLCFYIRLVVKYILLSDSEECQKSRMKSLESFLRVMKEMWERCVLVNNNIPVLFLEVFLEALKYNKVYFDAKYVSCMPVFETILIWLHSLLPIEKWFEFYVRLHLTMLYYKAARFCITQKPDFFSGDHQNLNKSIDMFGSIFGKFVARDYEELLMNYFQSIRVIYKKAIMEYMVNFIDYSTFDQSKERFAIAVIKSILNEKESKEAHFLASNMFMIHEREYFKYGFDLCSIKNTLNEINNKELRICLQIQSGM